ncbi:glycan-binding surface protein [Salinimicrobium sp. MT39]|uniref:Glycan-binding surface protein n=1 Tax=Salinimicrobium profundisediminis TaxID=2994553 RepID=A0A9X3HZL3_9FLAO|nr:glycan-binding surface protein [Salinimicrobium profundisediminis]MCX2836614.1 glycan-binding surface protein [Salinimicrobium profundisediminis]
MKKVKINSLLILLAVVGFVSCEKEDDLYPQLGDDPRNLSEIISSTPNLSSFYGAMGEVETNIDSILRQTTTYTVFAPQDAAFSSVDSEVTQNLVLNHMISTLTADFSHNLSTGYAPTMATGPEGEFLDLFINTEGGISLNGMATVQPGTSDVGATNGVLHVIDGVLVPPTVADHAEANPNFSMLAAAIERAGLTETLSIRDTENESYPITFFAPTNAAFENLISRLNGAFGWATLEDVPVETLQEILMYHVVPGDNTLSALVPGSEFIAMDGNSFAVDDNSIISDASYDTANIVLTDVQAVNGVMHGIDKVLLPENVFQSILGATLDIKARAEDKGYSSFLAAAEKAGLSTMLAEDELTAFIPNNDAFTALFAVIENFESLEDFDTPEEIALLKGLLEYHLHSGVIMSSQLKDGLSISTLHKDNFTVDLSGDNPRLQPTYEDAIPSTIVMINIGATNGVIHEINRLLVPNELVKALGFPSDEGGVCPVGDPELVFFDWDDKGIYWGNVAAENDASISLDGSSYGRANFQTGGTGWQDLFWRNGGTLNGGAIVGDDLQGYSLKFEINVIEPINDGMFRIRFKDSDGVDAIYNWQPWEETGEPFSTDGWETIEIPLSVLGVPDFSLIDAEFGMAFEGADVLLNFAIDNVRFDTPGGCGSGPDPVADTDAVFFDWDNKGKYWGAVEPEDNPAVSLDGSKYGRINQQTGSDAWFELFWRNDDTFYGADMVGSNVDDYVLKFDLATFEPINDGMFKIRFNASTGVDAFYNWQPWEETGEAFDTQGNWVTVTIPVSALGQPDFGLVDAEFGMAFQGADILLNFAIDNVRFEKK